MPIGTEAQFFCLARLTWAIDWFLTYEAHAIADHYANHSGLPSGVIFSDQFAEPLSESASELVTDNARRDSLSQLKNVNSKTYRHHLGTENSLVFFADPQMNIDALAALSGTICAGGLLYVWLGDGDSKQAASNPAVDNTGTSFISF